MAVDDPHLFSRSERQLAPVGQIFVDIYALPTTPTTDGFSARYLGKEPVPEAVGMPIEIWPEYHTDKSWRVLSELNARASPILIGGWAVYLWTGALKSADVDLFMTDDSLWKIETRIRRHPKLKKVSYIRRGGGLC